MDGKAHGFSRLAWGLQIPLALKRLFAQALQTKELNNNTDKPCWILLRAAVLLNISSCRGLQCASTHFTHVLNVTPTANYYLQLLIINWVPQDNISGRVLKECAGQLTCVLTDIFNTSLDQAIVSSCFKTATTFLVPKKLKSQHSTQWLPACCTDSHYDEV